MGVLEGPGTTDKKKEERRKSVWNTVENLAVDIYESSNTMNKDGPKDVPRYLRLPHVEEVTH